MNCLKCSTSNIGSAQFCKNCGSELTSEFNQHLNTSEKDTNLLLLVLASSLVLSVFYFIINQLDILQYSNYSLLRDFTSLGIYIITLFAAVKIKHKKAKQFLFISVSVEFFIYLFYKISGFIHNF